MGKVRISELNIQITGNAAGLLAATRASRNSIQVMARLTNSSAREMQGSFLDLNGTLTKTLALFGGLKAASIAKNELFDSVRLAANAEQTAIGFEVLLGNAEAAKNVIADLYKFVETTPFRLEEVQQSAKLLSAFGFEQKKLLPTLRALGDIASATGDPLKEIADLYGRTRVENRLYTRDLNQFTSRGIDVLSKMADQFGVTKSEIRAMAEAGTLSFADIERAIASMTARGGQYFKLTQRQAETTAGEFSNFLDEVDALKREFGAGLLPTLGDFLGLIRETIAGTNDQVDALAAMRDAGKTFGTSLRFAVSTIQSAYAGLIGVNIEAAEFIDNTARIQAALTGFDLTPFTSGYLDSLNKQYDEAIERAEKLFKIGRESKANSRVGGADNETLADQLGNLTDAAIGAKKQLELLEKQATSTADKIREKYASPLEKFKQNVREIQQAAASGGLEPEFVNRALAGEIEALRNSYRGLKNELKDNPANERGSQEAIAANFRRKYGKLPQDDNKELNALIAQIAKEQKQNAEQIKAAAKQTATEASELKEESKRTAASVAELGVAASKTAKVILDNITANLNRGGVDAVADATKRSVQIAGFGANAFGSQHGVELGQKLGGSSLGRTQEPGSLLEVGKAFGDAINSYFKRTQEPTSPSRSDSIRLKNQGDRLRSNDRKSEMELRGLRRDVSQTGQSQVQVLKQIASTLANAPEPQRIEIIEHSL
tara:strand:- start:14461 stop:16617 length:2157 start_codon:yes stop_codon:yes gene_type:complete